MLIPVAQPEMQGTLLDLPLQPHCCISGLGLEGTCKDTQQTLPAPPAPGSASTATETCKQSALDIF